MKTILTATLAVLVLTSTVVGQDKKPASFGALETMNAADAKTKLAAWLKEVGKSDAATVKEMLPVLTDALQLWLKEGITPVMNKFSGKTMDSSS